MNQEDRLKRLQTDVKSAQGSIAMALALTLIYMVRTGFAKNTDFYFSMYTVEFLVKYSEFFPSFKGNLNGTVTVILTVLFIAGLLALTVISQKKPACLYGCLAVYVFDTVFLLTAELTGFFAPFEQSDLIDVIVHAFVLTFLVIGVVAHEKLKKTAQGESNKSAAKA